MATVMERIEKKIEKKFVTDVNAVYQEKVRSSYRRGWCFLSDAQHKLMWQESIDEIGNRFPYRVWKTIF